MPCYDERSSFIYSSNLEIEPLKKELEKVEAMLCAIVQVLVESKAIIPVVEAIDTEETGVTPNDIAVWWTIHKEKDAKRKKQEKKDE
jgi:hypothetical protein